MLGLTYHTPNCLPSLRRVRIKILKVSLSSSKVNLEGYIVVRDNDGLQLVTFSESFKAIKSRLTPPKIFTIGFQLDRKNGEDKGTNG